MLEGVRNAEASTSNKRKENLITRAFVLPPREWCNSQAKWCQTLVGRMASNRVKMGRMFVVFIRALVAVTFSNSHLPPASETGKYCREAVEAWEKARDEDGRVPISAILDTFPSMGSFVFREVLELLNWAGHIGAFGTLNLYRFVVTAVSDAYWEKKHGPGRPPGAWVMLRPIFYHEYL